MKRLLKLFAFLGGLGAVGWLIRHRFIGMTMNREPELPEMAPEPVVDPPPTSDLTRLDGIARDDVDRFYSAGITTAAQLAAADARTLAARTRIDEAQLVTWIEQAGTLA